MKKSNGYFYGIDLGGTNIKFGLFNENIELIDSFSIPTPKNENIIKTLYSEIIKDLEKKQLEAELVYGIGLAVPGPVHNGVAVKLPNVNMPENINIKTEFENCFDRKMNIVVANDASVAAFAEYKISSSDYQNVVFYTLGTGVGGGIIVDGKLLEGKKGIASEIGHMKVFFDEMKKCGCGQSGCLEQMVGVNYLIEEYKRLIGNNRVDNISVKEIFDLAKKGDEHSNMVVDKMSYYIAVSAVNLAVTLEPDVFIIGGGISHAGEFLINRIVHKYRENARFTSGNIPFVLAKLGNNAGIIGAAHLAKESYNNNR